MSKAEISVAQDRASSEEGANPVLTAETAVQAVKAGRAKDVDIAAHFIAEHGQELRGNEYTKEEEKKLIRKVDWRLVPIVSRLRPWTPPGTSMALTRTPALRLRYTLRSRQNSHLSRRHLRLARGPQLDRAAVLLVRLRAFLRRLGLHGTGCVLSAKVRASPALLARMCRCACADLVQRMPVVTFFSANVLCWGIAEMAMAACTNFTGLFICRFLLGGFEALLIPAVTLLV